MREWLSKLLPFCALVAVMGLSRHFGIDVAAQPADPAVESKDIEILGHGPIHEAFAQPASPTLDSTLAVNKKPPDPVEELPPDIKPDGDNVVWILGYWAFDAERQDFIWISGFWRNVPPSRVWVGGYWAAVGAEYRWVPGYWSEPATTQVYYPPPPEVIVESPPPAPDDNSYYVAGTWIYRDTRYLWRPGFWTPYRPGWLWTQPRYSWTPGGFIFADGYWDHDFNNRGVLFAPAYFGPSYFGANRSYRPSFALSTDLLYASLFVRPSAGFYYFGDYYGPRYAGLGYTPWLDYRYRGRYADPAWSQYAWQNRGTPRWEAQMRATYASRKSGESPPPPRRIDPQPNGQPQPKGNNTQTVNLVMPLNQMQVRNDVKFRPVSKDELKAIQTNAAEARTLTNTRLGVEAKIDPKASSQQPVKANIALPQVAVGGKATKEPPPSLLPKNDPQATPPKTQNPDNPRTPPVPPAVTPPTPKTEPSPKIPAPPVVPQPVQPKNAPVPPIQPKATPLPKVTPPPVAQPPIAPPPKSTPPIRVEPKNLPAPTPTPKAAPVQPPPAPKAAPIQSQPVPQPAPRVDRPAAPPLRPDAPKAKGKDKD